MKCNKVENINTFVSFNNSRNFFLDTNALYWYVYPRYGLYKPGVVHQANPYFEFVDKLVADGNPLFTSVYNISELLNVIEKNEYEIFITANPDSYYKPKDFRKDPVQRKNVLKMQALALSNVDNICSVVDHNFSYIKLKEFSTTLTQHRCDPFDYVILDHCTETGNFNIISDDDDFSTFTGINLFTANEVTLNASK